MEHCLFIVDLAVEHGGSFHRFLQLPSRPWMANGPWQVCDGYALHERLDGYHQYPNHSSCAESHGRNSGFSTFGFRSLDEKRIFSTCWEGSVLFFLGSRSECEEDGETLELLQNTEGSLVLGWNGSKWCIKGNLESSKTILWKALIKVGNACYSHLLLCT